MSFLDKLFERSSRHVADTTSRRKVLARLGSLIVAGAARPAVTTGATARSTVSCARAAAVRLPPARPAPMPRW